MNQALSLSEAFDKQLFRIPDYQRGYSWREKQLAQCPDTGSARFRIANRRREIKR